MRFLPRFNSAGERAVTHIEALRVQRPEQPKLEVGEDLGLLSPPPMLWCAPTSKRLPTPGMVLTA